MSEKLNLLRKIAPYVLFGGAVLSSCGDNEQQPRDEGLVSTENVTPDVQAKYYDDGTRELIIPDRTGFAESQHVLQFCSGKDKEDLYSVSQQKFSGSGGGSSSVTISSGDPVCADGSLSPEDF